MGYHVLDPSEIEPMSDRPVDARSISDAVGLQNMGVRLYRVHPGEQLPLTYHYHERQEELFYVIDGPLFVDTPDGTRTVRTGSVFVAEPNSPHRAYNSATATGDITVLAVGAPAADDARAYEPE